MKILVTGAAGFIGYFVAQRLLDAGHEVIGLDNLNDYYDPGLKRDRLARLSLPYATFLSIFQLGFIALQPVYYRGPWVFIPNYIGVVSLGLALVQLWLFLRSPQRQSRASRNPHQTMGHSEVQPGLPLSRE